jgi:uncharacterized protein YndB with AHSA1/START domain
MDDGPQAGDMVVIERIFDAPADVVWRMWTEPEHFAAWYGPDGATVPVARMDVRVGGTRLVGMEVRTPNGSMRMWFTGTYREVVAHRRLVYTESPADAEGRVLSPAEAGMPEGHPVQTQVIVELEDLGGRTRMVLTHVGVPAGSPGAAGWKMALDALGALVAAAVRR